MSFSSNSTPCSTASFTGPSILSILSLRRALSPCWDFSKYRLSSKVISGACKKIPGMLAGMVGVSQVVRVRVRSAISTRESFIEQYFIPLP